MDFSQTVVAQIMGSPVTQGQLKAAFGWVEDKSNWKNPINKSLFIDCDFDMELIREAVVFFTGSRATFTAKGRNQYQVKAAGYYATIGA